MNITIWNEYRHERAHEEVARVYPDGIHMQLARVLEEPGRTIRTATLDEPEHGLPTHVLADTDVLLWWGHMAHDEVDDEIVDRVQARVLDGMGLVVLHSGHHAKVFKRLMGTSCNLIWREADNGERERMWVVNPAHPIADGVDSFIELPAHEMYGEPFDIPEPEELVFVSWFEGGEVFRSGCCYRRGRGRVFYFSAGHETFPIYMNPAVIQVVRNGVLWAQAPHASGARLDVTNRPTPIEEHAPVQSRKGVVHGE